MSQEPPRPNGWPLSEDRWIDTMEPSSLGTILPRKTCGGSDGNTSSKWCMFALDHGNCETEIGLENL